MAEATGMMIFMRLDALIGAYPSTFANRRDPDTIKDSDRVRLMPADITAPPKPAMSRYKCLRSRQFFVRTDYETALARRLDHIAIASP
jgi:hypothetical protein